MPDDPLGSNGVGEREVLVASHGNACVNDLVAIAFPRRFNSVVQSAGSVARGFRITVYFKTVIFFRLGKLDFTARMQLSYAIHRK